MCCSRLLSILNLPMGRRLPILVQRSHNERFCTRKNAGLVFNPAPQLRARIIPYKCSKLKNYTSVCTGLPE